MVQPDNEFQQHVSAQAEDKESPGILSISSISESEADVEVEKPHKRIVLMNATDGLPSFRKSYLVNTPR